MRHTLQAFVLVMLFGSATSAQWTQVSTPFGVKGYGVALVGDTLWGGTSALNRSTDFGQSWVRISGTSFPAAGAMTNVVRTPTGLYAAFYGGTGGQSVFRSTDNGTSWVSASAGLPSTFGAFVLAYSAGRLYAGGWSADRSAGAAGLYWSSNGGASWGPVPGSRTTLYPALLVTGDTIIAGTSYDTVAVSTNAGASWTYSRPSGGGNAEVTSFARIRDTLFATVREHTVYTNIHWGVYRSTDLGTSWTRVVGGFPNPGYADLTSLAVLDTVLWAGTNDLGIGGIWKSTDRGSSWIDATPPLMVRTQPPYTPTVLRHDIVRLFAANGALYASSNGFGLYRTTDGGLTWEQITTQMGNAQRLLTMARRGDTLYTAGAVNGVFRSTDNGLRWTNTMTNLLGQVSSVVWGTDTSFMALYLNGAGAGRSADGGRLWQTASAGLPPSLSDAQFMTETAGELFAATSAGVFRSTNSGGLWSGTGMTLPVRTVFARPPLLIAGLASSNRTFVSTNNGASFDTLRGGVPADFGARAFAQIGGRIFMGGGGGARSVLRSTDNGATWTNVSGPISNAGVLFAVGDTLIAAGTAGAYWTVNDGGTWTLLRTVGLPSVAGPIAAFEYKDGWLFSVGSGYGVYRTTLRNVVTAVGGPSETGRPSTLALSQNYPNPFNPVTTIRFELPEAGDVVVRVFNVLGEEVATLLSGRRAAGRHEVMWEAGTHPSGVYFYRLEAGLDARVGKMVLLR